MIFTYKGFEIFHDPCIIDMVGVRLITDTCDGEISNFDTVEQAIDYVIARSNSCKNCGVPIGISRSTNYCGTCSCIIFLGQ